MKSKLALNALLIKLSKSVLFAVEIMQSVETTETAEELENAVDEISKGEFDETKEKNRLDILQNHTYIERAKYLESL